MYRKVLMVLIFTLGFTNLFSQVDHVRKHIEEMRVNMVELDVKAVNLSGRFISGLTPDDFVVRENGVIQNVVSFDEIQLGNLAEEDVEDYQSKIMLLLDFKNSSYSHMLRVFPQLRQFLQTEYNGKSKLGIAANTDGIQEIQPFTADKDLLFNAIDRAENHYKKTRFRSIIPGNSFTVHRGFIPTGIDSFQRRVDRREAANYYRSELEVLGQFVHYLGAFTGKKNLVLISEKWQYPSVLDDDNVLNLDGAISLKDIQTAGLYNKIAINVINLNPVNNLAGNYNRLEQRDNLFFFEQQAALASATAGYYFTANQLSLAGVLGKTIRNAETFYRIRYYSDYTGTKYRRVRVAVKGAKRVGITFEGYYPNRGEMPQAAATANLTASPGNQFNLTLETDWMNWQFTGWRKKDAYYAVSQRAFDQNGALVFEKVTAGSIVNRKSAGAYVAPTLNRTLNFDLPSGVTAARLEVEVVDLNTGEKVNVSSDRGGRAI